jgi:hypothetical protein
MASWGHESVVYDALALHKTRLVGSDNVVEGRLDFLSEYFRQHFVGAA